MLVYKPGGCIVLTLDIDPHRRGAMDPHAWFPALLKVIFERNLSADHAFVGIVGVDLGVFCNPYLYVLRSMKLVGTSSVVVALVGSRPPR